MTDEEENRALSEYRLIGPSDDGQASDILSGLSPKEARQRLQALIAEWLRMENIVVLTAAGCSKSCRGKLMNELEVAVLNTVKRHKKLPSEIVPVIESRLEKPKEGEIRAGFEEWLSFLVNAVFVGSAPQSPFDGLQWKGDAKPSIDSLEWLVDQIGKTVFAECTLKLPTIETAAQNAKDVPPHLAFLSKLVARDSNLGRIHLFTLNYDTLFEQALEMLGVQYFDGFSGRAEARFDPSVYGLDIYYPGEIAEGRVRRFDKFLHLYKLHGSIHWHVSANELHARHPDLGMTAEYQDANEADKPSELEKIAERIPSVGILPTSNKFTQTLSMPYAHLFRSFQLRLSAPQTFVLVLGYGFGDDHVTQIIESALMNPSLIMLVVEPDANSAIVERIRSYKDLGKRAFVLTPTKKAFDEKPFELATFDDFSRSIMPDVQWLDDFLRLRRFEKQIKITDDRKDGG